jgi:hypothetical protein
MTMLSFYKIPHHGSYPSEFVQLRSLMSFSDTRSYGATAAAPVVQIILGLVRRAYPEATEESVYNYPNKCFTIVGRTYRHDYLIVFFHDYTWEVARMSSQVYDDWVQNKPYYTAVPDDLPQCG